MRRAMVAFFFILSIGRAEIDNIRYLGHNEVNAAHLMDAEIIGSRAYISVGVNPGLEVYDLANPASPQRLYQTGSASWRSRSYGDTLLLLFCRREGVILYRISATGAPTLVGQYNPPGNLEALEGGAISGTTLYCAAHQNGVYAIDISNPAAPVKTGSIALDTSAAWNVEVRDSFLLVANGRYGLAVVGLQGGMHLSGRLSLPGLANDLALSGSTLIVSLGPGGVATVDVSNPRTPVLLDSAGTSGNAWGLGLRNGLACVGSWHALELFSIANPAAIFRAGWDNTRTWAMGADIRSDSLIAFSDWSGMSCYRVGPDATADIDVDPMILDYGAVGTVRDTTVLVRNTGAAALNVSSVTAPSGIAVAPPSFSVPAGDSIVITVTASGAGTVSGSITYASNDPDESSFVQEVYKNNSAFPQYGSLAPDFTLLGTDGQSHTLSQDRGKVVFLQFGGGW